MCETDEPDKRPPELLCHHGNDFLDCTEVCARCGHTCGEHDDDGVCCLLGCPCEGWVEQGVTTRDTD